MVDVAHDMRTRFQRHVRRVDRALDRAVDGRVLGRDGAHEMRFPRKQKRLALHLAVEPAINLDVALCGDVADDLQAFPNDGCAAFEPEHPGLPSLTPSPAGKRRVPYQRKKNPLRALYCG